MTAKRPDKRWSGIPGKLDWGQGVTNHLAEFEVAVLPDSPHRRYSPEQWFFAALLSDAQHALHSKKERHFVEQWLNNEWDCPCPFSLVCSSLHLDEQYVRRTLLARGAGRKARALA